VLACLAFVVIGFDESDGLVNVAEIFTLGKMERELDNSHHCTLNL